LKAQPISGRELLAACRWKSGTGSRQEARWQTGGDRPAVREVKREDHEGFAGGGPCGLGKVRSERSQEPASVTYR